MSIIAFVVIPVVYKLYFNRLCYFHIKPDRPTDRPESGILRFLDTRSGANGYLDIANRRLRSTYALKSREVRLEEGQVIVFPSFVFHEVSPFYGRDTRITVATNCWFT